MPPRKAPETVMSIGNNKFWIRLGESETESGTWILTIRPRKRKGFQLTPSLVVRAISGDSCTVIGSVKHLGADRFSLKTQAGYRRSKAIASELMTLVVIRFNNLDRELQSSVQKRIPAPVLVSSGRRPVRSAPHLRR